MKQEKSTQTAYNNEVKRVYFKILKQAKAMLSTIEQEELRYTLTRDNRHINAQSIMLYQFSSPLLYLRLDLYNGEMCIHYGFEMISTLSEYYSVCSSFTRLVYKLTLDNGSPINIENALRVDWVITNASDVYEYIEEQNLRTQRFELITYKPQLIKRKLKRVA